AWQWCADWYGAEYYAKSPVDDPNGPDPGDGRVLRGGSWFNGPNSTRSAFRDRAHAGQPGRQRGVPRFQDSVTLWPLAVLPFSVFPFSLLPLPRSGARYIFRLDAVTNYDRMNSASHH
ncbi:MAG: SUMF1/EgtB/PvdO family nonheme iron enzyme, partial [Planctomycetota bacterium]